MSLGEYRYDRMQVIWGWHHISSVHDNDQAGGAFYANPSDVRGISVPISADGSSSGNEVIQFNSSFVTRTGAKTEPENVVLNGYIIAK